MQGNYGRTALLSKLAVPTAANEREKLKRCPVSQQSIACVSVVLPSTSQATPQNIKDLMHGRHVTLFQKQCAPS